MAAPEAKAADPVTAEEKLAAIRAAMQPHMTDWWDHSGINNEFTPWTGGNRAAFAAARAVVSTCFTIPKKTVKITFEPWGKLSTSN